MWFLDNPARVKLERSEIDKLYEQVNWLNKADWKLVDSQLCINADIDVNNYIYSVQMIYPALFPLIPPSMKPLDTKRLWSCHQYISGELCLEWGPDNWQENITGADLLRSVYKLLAIDRPLENEGVVQSAAPSRHALSLGQEIRNSQLRFLKQSGVITFLKNQPERVSGFVDCYLVYSRESVTAFIGALQPLDGNKWNNPMFPKELEKTTFHIKGQFFKLHLTTSAICSLNISELKNTIKTEGYACPNIGDDDNQLLLVLDEALELHFFRCRDKDDCYMYQTLSVPDMDLASRVGDSLHTLGNACVGIVGLGSAGSKIAVSLARSGVRDFLLIDSDLFFPENICRHELTWEDVGQHKVDGIAHLLQLIDPVIRVNSRKLVLSGQEASSATNSALNALSRCGIIIDATAEENVFNLLSNTVFQSKTPYIWLQIFAGGIGGLLCRFRPEIEPNPKEMRASLLDCLAQFEQPTLMTQNSYSATDCSGKTIIALDADVSVIAGHATRMAIDLLSRCIPSIFPYSIYLIGFSKGWVFKEPFYTIPIDITGIKSHASSIGLPIKDDEDNIKFIKGLLDQN